MNQQISIIQELLATGLTQKQLGALIGKSQAWVGAVLAGKFSDLKWKDGEALLRLRKERVAAASDHAGSTPQSQEQEAA